MLRLWSTALRLKKEAFYEKGFGLVLGAERDVSHLED